jgi:hypothetical protein
LNSALAKTAAKTAIGSRSPDMDRTIDITAISKEIVNQSPHRLTGCENSDPGAISMDSKLPLYEIPPTIVG